MFCFMPFFDETTGNLIYPIALIIGFFHAAAITIPWAIVPDVVEFDELKSGKRREGLFYGGTTFSYKAATGLAFLLSTAVLELSGYAANEVQSPMAHAAIRALIGPLPAFVLIIAAYLATRYPLTKERHRKIISELAARKTARSVY
jgi:GPH family glycoside/pentoside/hexuronide:cation symporter